MNSPGISPSPGPAGAPAAWPAQLRQILVTYFDESDIASLCFDLGVDYESLEGEGKQRKAIELIKEMVRSDRVVDLIDLCARQRPNVPWDALRAEAIRHPDAALPALPEPGPAGRRPVLNLSPDRALKLGVALGALMVLLLLCGFSGGLIAGRFIQFTADPVRPTMMAASAAAAKISAAAGLPSGAPVDLSLSNVQATSLAALYLVSDTSTLSDIHIRFTDQSEVVVNLRLRPMNDLQILAVYTLGVKDHTLVLSPKTVTANALGLQDTTFGWVILPAFTVDPLTRAAQQQLDQASAAVAFDGAQVSGNAVRVWGARK